MVENIEKEDIEKMMEHNERLIEIQKKMSHKIGVLEERIEDLEGLDVTKYLKDEMERDEVVDERIANLLQIANQLRSLNTYKRDAILDYLSKKAGIGKTDLTKVIKAFEKYLDKI